MVCSHCTTSRHPALNNAILTKKCCHKGRLGVHKGRFGGECQSLVSILHFAHNWILSSEVQHHIRLAHSNNHCGRRRGSSAFHSPRNEPCSWSCSKEEVAVRMVVLVVLVVEMRSRPSWRRKRSARPASPLWSLSVNNLIFKKNHKKYSQTTLVPVKQVIYKDILSNAFKIYNDT